MSWAKVKKTSLDHVKNTAIESKKEELAKIKEDGEVIGNGLDSENHVNGNGVESEDNDHSQTNGKTQKSSWTKLNKKVTPAARFSSGKIKRDESWIVEERLKSNFYLDDGVSKWKIIYPVANGNRQSPIDIETGKAHLDKGLRPLEVRYDTGCVKSVVNTGNSFMVNVEDKMTSLIGGALKNEYRLIQFHAHWGTTAGAKGSEHTVNGKLYDAELHLVHWNTRHGLFTNAVSEPDGLAVIGIFLEIGEKDHPEFEKVIKVFDEIHFKNKKCPYEEDVIDPAKFLPDDLSYWHYEGSLTTPPLDESVLWHVLRTPIQISKRQLDTLAELRTGTDKNCVSCIINNFRPPVPLGNRQVKLFTGEAVEMNRKAHNENIEIIEEVSNLKKAITELQGEVKSLKSAVEQKLT